MFFWTANVLPVTGLFTPLAASAAAQIRPIMHLTPAMTGTEEDSARVTALNVCEGPTHVKMTILDGAAGREIGESWDATVDSPRTAHLDVTLNSRGATAQRVFAKVEVPPGLGGRDR